MFGVYKGCVCVCFFESIRVCVSECVNMRLSVKADRAVEVITDTDSDNTSRVGTRSNRHLSGCEGSDANISC